MFDKFYNYRIINHTEISKEGQLIILHRLTFRSISNIQYIVEVEQHKSNFYAIKFYAKNNRLSDNKYKISLNEYSAQPIIRTCINIMIHFYNVNPNASFGFIAERGINENEDAKYVKTKLGTIFCRKRPVRQTTKRFEVYRFVVEQFFSPVVFDHYVLEGKNVYLLINKNTKETDLFNRIEKMLEEMYSDYLK